ncbi:MAG TPA: cellulase family glycosylhydrolase [Puia sp.]
MNLIKPFFLLLLTSFCMTQSRSQGFLKADNKRIINEKGENVILRGIGLGGWMVQEGYMLHLNKEGQQYRIKQRIELLIGKEQTQEFYKAWLSNHTSKSDIDSLHSWGFNSVRLPMHYNLFTLPIENESVEGKNTWQTVGFALTDSLVSWCKANGMYVILDLHAAPGGQGNDLNISDRDPSKPSLWQSEANRQKTIALWRKLAERYANEPTVGGYDILNEPNWGFEDTLNDRNGLKEKKNIALKQLLMDITKAIREVDKKHIIIIEGNGWGNNYNGMLGTWDDNMVLSFHKYWNSNDLKSIQYILNYRDQYNVPVWLGETGENSNVWFMEAIRLFESNNIGWSWWPLKKLGINNPLQIKSNPDYNELVDYWNGKTEKPPSEKNVYNALLELAAHTKCESNIVHRDVIDAMIRQPFSNETKPFKANDILPGSIIQAVDYDLGRNGDAYYDKDTANYRLSTGKASTGNSGGMYRNDGVDIYADTHDHENFYVGKIEDGEWLQYTINVLESGKYNLVFTVAAENGEGLLSVNDGKSPIAQNVKIPATGSYEDWKTVKVANIELSKGTHQLRVYAVKGGFNFAAISFLKQ